jgi:hypothetical protein
MGTFMTSSGSLSGNLTNGYSFSGGNTGQAVVSVELTTGGS